MTTTNALATSTSSAAATAAAAGTSTNKTESPQDRFLTLLVNQMKNQDPLNPLENAEVTSQLAQISTVSGIDKLNETMGNMSKSLVGAQSMQASSMLGRHVIAPGNKVEFDGGEVPLGFQLDQSTPVLRVDVKDDKGVVIYSEEYSKQATPAGRHEFPWSGQVDSPAGGVAKKGLYTFEVHAVDANGISRKVGSTFGYAKVESVSLAGGVTVNTGALGSVAFTDVERVI